MAPQVQRNFDAELEWKELIKALPKELNQENSLIETQNISKPVFFKSASQSFDLWLEVK